MILAVRQQERRPQVVVRRADIETLRGTHEGAHRSGVGADESGIDGPDLIGRALCQRCQCRGFHDLHADEVI
ncbi:hypothetical protein D3C83_213420 [compost metagenome]